MLSRIFILIALLIGFVYPSMSFNYESKYGNGSNVDNFTQDTTAYYYFENLLDINLNYENINLYSQLEYSNPPIYGQSLTKTNNLANSYFIEYFNDFLILKWGHIQTINNYGLDINMFQDQSTDFDNRIKGIELNYMPNDLIEFSFITGKGNYGAKSYGDLRENDLIFSHDLDSYRMSIYSDFGDFSISTSSKRTNYKSGIYNNLINSDTRLSIDLQDYIFTDFSLFNQDSDVKSTAINFSYSKTLGDLDIYIENSSNTYNKILRDEQEEGNYKYIALSGDFLGIGFTYEFKDYDMLYYMPITSNPPTVFSETSSVLISRIQHNINFSDEIGHQLEFRYNSEDKISYLFNLSMGMKHSGVRNPNSFEFDDDFNITYDTYQSVSFKDFFGDKIFNLNGGMDFLNENLRAHKPFKNIYFEKSVWNEDNSFFYKLGFHSHVSYDDASGKNYQSLTIPIQFVIGFNNQNSLTAYTEYQQTKNLVANFDDFDQDFYANKHLALSYYFNKIGNVTYLIDEEIKTSYIDGASKKNKWNGIEFSIKMSPTMQLSIFKGSQKGGLVCANGVCAVQPSFENGTKITFRALF